MKARHGTIPIVLAAAMLLVACGGDDEGQSQAEAPGPEHVHGLGINPADGALYIATHWGVFRSGEGSEGAERVGEGLKDTMGFTVVGPDHFLGSGHPAPGEEGPPNLGLIESTDGGETWDERSLGGDADFHVLVAAHDRIYGYDATGGRLMLSDDGGSNWSERTPPGAVIDLAVDPDDPQRIVASTDRGLGVSENDGRRWKPLGPGDQIGLLAWPSTERLYLVDAEGTVHISSDAGEGWEEAGRIGAQPVALVAEGADELYAALPDGTVVGSDDGGTNWGVRVRP